MIVARRHGYLFFQPTGPHAQQVSLLRIDREVRHAHPQIGVVTRCVALRIRAGRRRCGLGCDLDNGRVHPAQPEHAGPDTDKDAVLSLPA